MARGRFSAAKVAWNELGKASRCPSAGVNSLGEGEHSRGLRHSKRNPRYSIRTKVKSNLVEKEETEVYLGTKECVLSRNYSLRNTPQSLQANSTTLTLCCWPTGTGFRHSLSRSAGECMVLSQASTLMVI